MGEKRTNQASRRAHLLTLADVSVNVRCDVMTCDVARLVTGVSRWRGRWYFFGGEADILLDTVVAFAPVAGRLLDA